MADKKIIDLTPIVSQNSTDLYETSANGTGSYKETRAQMLSYMSANVQITEDQVTNLKSDLLSKLNLSGGTMTGNLILNADPTLPLQAATKQYVDSGISSDTFQDIYNNSSPPSFNISSSGFQINDNLSNPLFSVAISPSLITMNSNLSILSSLVTMSSPMKLIMGTPSGSNYALAQFNSTQYGILPPVLNSTQETTLVGLLGSIDKGLQWYNSTNNINSYWDGLDKQDVLAIGNIIQGANMSITDNGNGTVTFAASGGGVITSQIQGSFNSSTPTTPTPVTALDTPIAVSGFSFNVVNAVGTNVSLATIGGIQTVIIQNTSTGGRWCTVNYDLTLLIATNSNQTYGFTVYTNTGAVIFFKDFTVTGTAPLYRDFTIATPLVYLNTNDYVYLTASSSLNSGPTFNAYQFNGRLIDTTVASLPSTDSLSQGTNNVYLSQNAGTTYEYLSGTATVGDIAQFNSPGGQLIDSGIAASSIITTSSTLGGSLSGTLPNPSLSATGINQIIAITQVSGSTQAMTDSAPINRYVLENTSPTTLTLPSSMTIGHTIEIYGGGAGLWIVGQNSGQMILTSVGGSPVSTTTGVTGYAQCSNYADCMTLVYNGAGEFVIATVTTSGSGIILN